MSKQPPRAKRKTSSYAEDNAAAEEESCIINTLLTNLDLSQKSTTPKVVAKALLSLLPQNASKHSESAKKLVSSNIYEYVLYWLWLMFIIAIYYI